MALLHKIVLAICLLSTAQAVKQHAGDRTITQVVALLQEMMDKSKADGETERDFFAKHKCYCDENEEEKNSEITALQKEIKLLEAKIAELLASTGLSSEEAARLKREMAANEESRNTATSLRQQEHDAFVAAEADLVAANDTLWEAIQVLAEIGADQTVSAAADHTQFMANYNVSDVALANLKTSLKQALVAASAFTSKKRIVSVNAFLETAPFTGTYTAQSGEVVGILKDMRQTFLSDLSRARDAEEKAVAAHGEFIQTKEEEYATMETQLQDKNGLMSSNDETLSTKRDQLSTAQDDLSGAEAFLTSLVDMCAEKKKQYDERVALRSKEEVAISQAIAILNSDAAFSTFGTVSATKDGATGPNFLQHKAIHRHGNIGHESPRQKAEAFLQKAAGAKGSPLLTRIVSMLQANNPFTIVLEEIKKMEQLIAAEEQADDEQKQWCDTARTDTDASIEEKTGQITELDGEIDQLGTDINDPQQGLKVSIAQIESSMVENRNSQSSETEDRRTENVHFQKDVANLVQAHKLLTKAIELLHAYYSKLNAETGALLQKREEPSPPDTWDDEFSGQSANGQRVLDMLNFIRTNTQAEETQAHEDEQALQHAYEDRMKELTEGYAGLQTSLASEKASLAQKELALMEKKKSLAVTTKEKEALEYYLEQIKPGCDFITTNIDDRKAARTAETEALQNARDLLKDTPAYLEAVAAAHNETLGNCLSLCAGNEDHAECKACLAGTSVPGYCAGHPGTDGC